VGEKKLEQVYGMLHSPDVEQKLIKAYPGEGIESDQNVN
jgi:hypothetical protein